jgi:hypothetical protein
MSDMPKYIIIFLIITSFLIDPISCQLDSSDDGDEPPEVGPIQAGVGSGDDDDEPPEVGHIGSGTSRPRTNLLINISTLDSAGNHSVEFNRGEIISLIYTVETENGKNTAVDNGIIKIPPELKVISMDLGRFNFDDIQDTLSFKEENIHSNEVLKCSYIASVSLMAEPGDFNLSEKTIGIWDWSGKIGVIDNNKIIHVNNNVPRIESANVIVPRNMENYCMPCKDKLIYKKSNYPLILDFNIDASDDENELLKYNWSFIHVINETDNIDKSIILENTTPEYNENNSIFFTKSSSEDSHELYLSRLDPGIEYSFFLSVTDSIDSTDKIPVNIAYMGNRNYTGIYIPQNDLKIPIILYILIIGSLCIIGFIRGHLHKTYNRCVSKFLNFIRPSHADEFILGLTILSITLVYIYLNIYLPQSELTQGSYKLVVYLKSLNLFEIYVYLVVFVAVVYFTEACFGQEFKPDSKKARAGTLSRIANSINLVTVSKLWIINSIFMLVLLLSLDAIILNVNQLNVQDWLMNYYGEMGEIFATILAIIAAFYTAIPKNIISPWGRGASQQDKPYRYLHTKILHYFLLLYGVIVALSIWGFSVGLTVEFPALVELSRANLFNLVSIAVFETTLLLVPPAISCLYELLRSMLFTGNVKIMSTPSGAKIWVDDTYTRLLTPNVLMLPKGFHKIVLKKEGYKDYEVKGESKELKEKIMICIDAGTEQEYECRLKSKRLVWRKTS